MVKCSWLPKHRSHWVWFPFDRRFIRQNPEATWADACKGTNHWLVHSTLFGSEVYPWNEHLTSRYVWWAIRSWIICKDELSATSSKSSALCLINTNWCKVFSKDLTSVQLKCSSNHRVRVHKSSFILFRCQVPKYFHLKRECDKTWWFWYCMCTSEYLWSCSDYHWNTILPFTRNMSATTVSLTFMWTYSFRSIHTPLTLFLLN